MRCNMSRHVATRCNATQAAYKSEHSGEVVHSFQLAEAARPTLDPTHAMTMSTTVTSLPTNVQLAGVPLAGVATANAHFPGVLMYATAVPTTSADSAAPKAKEEDLVDNVAGECSVSPAGAVKVCSDHSIKEDSCTVTMVNSLGKTFKGVFDERALADSATFRSSIKIKPAALHDMFKNLVKRTRGPLKIDELSEIRATPGSELAAIGEHYLRCKFTVTQDTNSSLGLEGCCYLVEQTQDSISRLEGVILSLISRIEALEAKRA